MTPSPAPPTELLLGLHLLHGALSNLSTLLPSPPLFQLLSRRSTTETWQMELKGELFMEAKTDSQCPRNPGPNSISTWHADNADIVVE